MQIQLNIDTNNPKDVAIAANTLGYMAGFFVAPQSGQPEAQKTTASASEAPAATQAPTPEKKPPAEQPAQPEATKTAKVGKKKAAEATAPALTASGTLDFTAVKAKLQSYSEDARFGMDGVLVILNKYGVQRISALPEARYTEFVTEIDEALAGQPDPLA